MTIRNGKERERETPMYRCPLTTVFICFAIVLLVTVGFLQSTKHVRLSWDSLPQYVDSFSEAQRVPSLSLDHQHDANITKTTIPSFLHFTPPCEDPSSDCKIPKWMKEFFRWQRETLENITQPTDWIEHRILVVECVNDDACGGTADRLRPIPFYLALAASSKRLFFIRWSKPIPLEGLVEPFQLNWSMPDTLATLIDDRKGGEVVKTRHLAQMGGSSQAVDVWVLQVLSQTMTYFEAYRNVVLSSSMENDTIAEPILEPWDYFHDLFLALFRPVPGLQNLIDETMQRLNLVPNQYMVAHIRSLYPKHPYAMTGNIHDLEPAVWNAVDCASYVMAGLPVFVASDTLAAKQIAQEYGRSNRTMTRVVSDLDLVQVTSDDENHNDSTTTTKSGTAGNPLHLNESDEKDPSAYYSIFLDLILMSQSRCVAFGAGGYGQFGAEASFNNSCWVRHTAQGRGRILKCSPTTS